MSTVSDEETVTFATARLDEEEARANAMEHFTVHEQPYYSCAGSRIEPYGDLEWGEEYCDCFLAGRKAKRLREIAAMRAILGLARHANDLDTAVEKEYATAPRDLAADPWHGDLIVRTLAAIWSDHPDYRQERKL